MDILKNIAVLYSFEQKCFHLEYCNNNAKDYIYLTSQREYDCLIALVEDGDVTTFDDLANYGMETKFLKNKINK